MKTKHRPLLLMILDGWGYREDPEFNAIAHANTPNWDHIWNTYPHSLIRASEAAVGLPNDQMGNSEVGHLNLGAGRVVYQEILRIARSIETGEFYENRTLTQPVDLAVQTGKAVHIIGLLSDGGVHSHVEHIHAMVKLALNRGAKKVYLHAFFDGRDTAPKSAEKHIIEMESKFKEFGGGEFASVVGRYYSMDRDNRWKRVKKAYDVIAHGEAKYSATTALEALQNGYDREETDEFVRATAIMGTRDKPVTINDGDVVFFMNFRSDRARQLTRAFIENEFDCFDRGTAPKLGAFITLTEYNSDFDVPVAYPPERLQNVFGEYISQLGLRQLRIAETEKYAHVTFFLNGGRDEPFAGEDRILVPSPDVATYDLQPEMSAPTVTQKLIDAVTEDKYDVIICNFANPDMVGHTGNFEATIKAIEALDICIGKVVDKVTSVGGEILITADHGNAEFMRNKQTGQPHTAHTTNPVPFIYIGRNAALDEIGALSDVTPTMLYLMDIEKPREMGGHSMVKLI
ncbi:MAG: 2,3-bisphosphoglycerate-independent phosphoglycerate mutase [Gammaproteobacteria bacterium]|nr:2,3-bisphosphoglycerate-independent phosphoglycerate mutase [Gammaproteobacteria bacterium]